MVSGGIYQIMCVPNGRIYVGSSSHIHQRWYSHRRVLRLGTHSNDHLQYAWSKYGEAAFVFTVLESCEKEQLEEREQFYISTMKPSFNVVTDVKRRFSKEMHAKIAVSLRARAALITHCPKGHPYDEANTMIHQGKRVCRRCNADRVAEIFASETPEEREARRLYARSQYEKNREDPSYKAAAREYYDAHIAEKKAYDAARKPLANAQRNERRANETPEQRETRLRQKRESYHRSKGVEQPSLFDSRNAAS